MFIRSTFSTIFVAGLTLAMVPLGCGAAQEQYPHALQPQQETASETNEWVMPEEVVEKWRGCVKTHASELRTYSHETKFEVKVDNDGVVKIVNLRHSTLHHEAIESCLSDALAGLSIPLSVFPERASSVPFSGGESMRDTRAPLGIAQALGGFVALGPVMVVVAGVTVTIVVTAVVVDTLEAIAKWEKIERHCIQLQNICLANPKNSWERWSTWGEFKDCGACARECKHRKGQWPEYKCPLSN